MSNERLKELKELYSKATPGEWEHTVEKRIRAGSATSSILVADCATGAKEGYDNAAFIITTRNAMPELIAMTEESLRLRELIEAYRAIKSLDKERARMSLEWSTAFNHGDSNHDAIFKRLEAKENELNQARQRLAALQAGESEGV